MPAITLKDLHQQIAQRERELQVLRQELGARQNQLSDLTRRKEKLQNQLRQVEKEIAVLMAASPSQAKRTTSTAPAPSRSPVASSSPGERPKLRELIVAALRDSTEPMTARQLWEEAERRGYEATRDNPTKSVEARIHELKGQGVVRRASGQPGYVLARSSDGTRDGKSKHPRPASTGARKTGANPARPASSVRKGGSKTSSSLAAKAAKSGNRGVQLPLSVVLRNILKNGRKAMSANELAERAQAAGYKSSSPNFLDIVRLRLAEMDGVVHTSEGSYRLKKY